MSFIDASLQQTVQSRLELSIAELQAKNAEVSLQIQKQTVALQASEQELKVMRANLADFEPALQKARLENQELTHQLSSNTAALRISDQEVKELKEKLAHSQTTLERGHVEIKHALENLKAAQQESVALQEELNQARAQISFLNNPGWVCLG